jgi:hypothetical protein
VTRDAQEGTSTFVWKETAPTSTYLVSVSVGKFDVNSLNPAKPKKTRPAREPQQAAAVLHRDHLIAARQGQGAVGSRPRSLVRDRRLLLLLLRNRYPFTSLGGIVTLQSFGLNLETQGKPTYAITRSTAPTDQGSTSSPTSSRTSATATS